MSISPAIQGSGAAPPVSERRSQPRKSVMDQRLITVNLDDKDAGLMVDISEAGMAVQALARIKSGATTLLHFELPDSASRIEAIGTVAWADSTSGRAGIRFDELSDDSRASLKKWIASQKDKEPVVLAPAAAPAAATRAVPAILGPDSKVTEIAGLQREVKTRGLDRDAALALIAHRTRILTHAEGAAIVLGDAKLMTCVASDGAAPPAGVQLRPDSGLSGECVRTGVTVRCEDTELDPRVDHDACRAMKLRSALVVPLFSRGNISGLVEVFYQAPRAFEGRDVLTLRRVADLISATLARPMVAAAMSATQALPYLAPSPPPPPPARAATPVAVATVPTMAAKPGLIACDVCGHENPHTSADCEKCDVPLPGRVGNNTPGLGSTAGVTSLALSAGSAPLDRYSREERIATASGIRLRVLAHPRLLLAIAVLLLLAGVLGWQLLRRYRSSTLLPITTTFDQPTTASASTLVPESAARTVTLDATPMLVKPSPVSTLAARLSLDASIKPTKPLPATPARDGASKSAAPVPVTAPLASAPVVAESRRSAPDLTPVVPPPALALSAANPTVATILSMPQAAPKLAAPVTAKVVPARLLYKVEPVYPKLAVQHHLQGTVVVKARILRSGRLADLQIQHGNELLVGAAIAALRQWRYKPQELDGRPVDADTTITLNFFLANGH